MNRMPYNAPYSTSTPLNPMPGGYDSRVHGSELLYHFGLWTKAIGEGNKDDAAQVGIKLLEAAARERGATQAFIDDLYASMGKSIQATKPPATAAGGGLLPTKGSESIDRYEPDPHFFYVLDRKSGAELRDVLDDLRNMDRYIKRGARSPSRLLFIGEPGCLAGDTPVNYLRANRGGGRPIALAALYRKFNGLQPSGRGAGRGRPWTDLTMPVFLQSLGSDGIVFYNRIVAIQEAGVKPLLRIDFDDGTHLRLTSDHPIATPGAVFVEAGSLAPNDTVLARGSMKPTGIAGKNTTTRPPRVIVNVKYHPEGWYKAVECNGAVYEYGRVPRARLVVEAHMNDLSYEEFVHCLKHNEEASRGLKFLSTDVDVHHVDEDTMNDDIGNLVVLPHAEHAREHGKVENFKVEYVREVRVSRITSCGEEMTYDVTMESPANNFAAGDGGIIVHNTGKTIGARWLGSQLGKTVCLVRIDGTIGSMVGETSKRLRAACEEAVEEDAIIVIDEFEAIAVSRAKTGPNVGQWHKETTSALLQLLDSLPPKQILIGATNVPGEIDTAVLRRLRKHVFFHPPDRKARAAMINQWWATAPYQPSAKRVLLDLTKGQSGDFLERACEEANRAAARRGEEVRITVADVQAAATSTAAVALALNTHLAPVDDSQDASDDVPNDVPDDAPNVVPDDAPVTDSNTKTTESPT